MDQSDQPRGASRRRFLAGTAASALLAGMPWPALPIRATAREAAPEGAEIATVRIYPAIGICRVGGSAQWFLAPELPGLPPDPEGGFKDGTELIKKQVQRFRIYAFDAEDRVVGELTTAEAEIAWSAHLANTKAAWYGFNNALDNGDLAPGLPGRKRNQYFVSDQRREEMLVIDGGKKTVSGASVNPDGDDPALAFEGVFWGSAKVGLGHLRTDQAGRLLVVPPDGKSSSPTNAGITSFSDNDGWHDDWCDGPVTAEVTLADGRSLVAEPSWVACVGPNFAPEIPPITTLYDVIEDLNTREGWAAPPALPISFTQHIYPTLRRTALMAWVTEAADLRQGWLPIGDLSDPAYLAQLADPSDAARPLREQVFGLFRDPANTSAQAYIEERLKIPYMLGDGINYDGSPLQWFQFPALQYTHLQAWAEGDFIDDFEPEAQAPQISALEEAPVEAQPDMLTRAALEPCSGGAFHPGVELTYYLRLAGMYARATDPGAEPFRIAHGNRDSLVQDLGFLLTGTQAFGGFEGTPPAIGPQMPGDLTRWMGLPWQCDAFSCQQVLLQENFPTAVWWPALLPIDVLPESYYAQGMRTDLPTEERAKFLAGRLAWSRGVAGIGYHADASYWDGITNMIQLWQRMGFVVKRPGPADPDRPDGVPSELFVETGRGETMEFRFDWRPSDGMLPN